MGKSAKLHKRVPKAKISSLTPSSAFNPESQDAIDPIIDSKYLASKRPSLSSRKRGQKPITVLTRATTKRKPKKI